MEKIGLERRDAYAHPGAYPQIWMQNTETSWDTEERSAGLFSHLFSVKKLPDKSS